MLANPTAPGNPRVLVIGLADPISGAGTQAALKAIGAAGGFSHSAVAAFIAQNSDGVQTILNASGEALRLQLQTVVDNLHIDVIRVGSVGTDEAAKTVATFLEDQSAPVVFAPTLFNEEGDKKFELASDRPIRAIADQSDVIVPNIQELGLLVDEAPAEDLDSAIEQAKKLAWTSDAEVLIDGGQFPAGTLTTLVFPDESTKTVDVVPVSSEGFTATTAALASAVATKIAAGSDSLRAATWATRWLNEALETASQEANMEINYFHTSRRMIRAADPLRGHAPKSDTEASATSLKPAGEHTQALWEKVGGALFTEIKDTRFVRDLVSGTLPEADFEFFSQQEALFLGRFEKALRLLGSGWFNDAEGPAQEEYQNAKKALGEAFDTATLTSTTRAASDHLIASAATSAPAIGQAAALTRYWFLAELGTYLAEHAPADNRHQAWIATYAGADYQERAREAIARVEETVAKVPRMQNQALEAFSIAGRYTVDLFHQVDQAWVIVDH